MTIKCRNFTLLKAFSLRIHFDKKFVLYGYTYMSVHVCLCVFTACVCVHVCACVYVYHLPGWLYDLTGVSSEECLNHLIIVTTKL